MAERERIMILGQPDHDLALSELDCAAARVSRLYVWWLSEGSNYDPRRGDSWRAVKRDFPEYRPKINTLTKALCRVRKAETSYESLHPNHKKELMRDLGEAQKPGVQTLLLNLVWARSMTDAKGRWIRTDKIKQEAERMSGELVKNVISLPYLSLNDIFRSILTGSLSLAVSK